MPELLTNSLEFLKEVQKGKTRSCLYKLHLNSFKFKQRVARSKIWIPNIRAMFWAYKVISGGSRGLEIKAALSKPLKLWIKTSTRRSLSQEFFGKEVRKQTIAKL